MRYCSGCGSVALRRSVPTLPYTRLASLANMHLPDARLLIFQVVAAIFPVWCGSVANDLCHTLIVRNTATLERRLKNRTIS